MIPPPQRVTIRREDSDNSEARSRAEVAASHAWRALELAGIANEPPDVLLSLAHAVVAATDSPVAESWLDLLTSFGTHDAGA